MIGGVSTDDSLLEQLSSGNSLLGDSTSPRRPTLRVSDASILSEAQKRFSARRTDEVSTRNASAENASSMAKEEFFSESKSSGREYAILILAQVRSLGMSKDLSYVERVSKIGKASSQVLTSEAA